MADLHGVNETYKEKLAGDLISVDEVARLTGKTRQTVSQWYNHGLLDDSGKLVKLAVARDRNRRVFTTRRAIQSFLDSFDRGPAWAQLVEASLSVEGDKPAGGH